MTKASNLPEAVKFVIYFHVLAIIVLEEAAERFGDEYEGIPWTKIYLVCLTLSFEQWR